MKKRALLIKLLLGSPVLVALIAGIFSIFRGPNASSQTINGNRSNAINIQGSQNTNINIDYSNRSRLVMDKIMFGERYAYEFDNYLGSVNEPGNMSRIIEQNTILRKRYNTNENVRLTPAIMNFNKGIPLKQARIQLVFSQDVVIDDTQRWTVQEVNNRYSWKFNESINNIGLNTDSIFVKFPKPGQYRLVALIDGENLEGVKEVNYFIELYE